MKWNVPGHEITTWNRNTHIAKIQERKRNGMEVQKLSSIIAQSDNIVFFGGAGVSTESGFLPVTCVSL